MSGTLHGGASVRAKRLARRFLGKGDRDLQQLQVVEPPPEYLMEDIRIRHSDLPHEFMSMLKNIKLFGHFDTQMFVELCKSLTTINLKNGQALFNVGDEDDTVYMVQSGCVCVSITETEGAGSRTLKEAKAGETIFSLLSFCDVLTGHKQPYKTISAHAMEPSVVVKFPVEAVRSIFQQHPTMFVRVVQIVMARLMRVTFTALHHYLGLSSELISRVPRRSSQTALSSPSRNRTLASDSGSLSPTTPPPVIVTSSGDYDEIDANAAPGLAGGKQSRRIVLVDPQEDNDESMLKIAVSKLQDLLKLPTDEYLRDSVELRHVDAGEFIMKQDSTHDIALVYVLTGSLQVSQNLDRSLASNASDGDRNSSTLFSGQNQCECDKACNFCSYY